MSISSRFTAEHGAIRFAYMDVGEGREQDAEASLIAPYGSANCLSRVSILQKNYKNGAFLVKLNMLWMRKNC